MALSDVVLSILAFPQRWSAAGLEARILLLPIGDPTTPPPGTNLPAFAGASWTLRAMVLPGLDSLLGPNPSASAGAGRVWCRSPEIPPPVLAARSADATRTSRSRTARSSCASRDSIRAS